jgi:hypothetical protein
VLDLLDLKGPEYSSGSGREETSERGDLFILKRTELTFDVMSSKAEQANQLQKVTAGSAFLHNILVRMGAGRLKHLEKRTNSAEF